MNNISVETINWCKEKVWEANTDDDRDFREQYLHNLNLAYAEQEMSNNRNRAVNSL